MTNSVQTWEAQGQKASEALAAKGFIPVDIDALSKSGVIYGTMFVVDDVIEFPPMTHMYQHYSEVGKKANGEPILAYHILVNKNGKFRHLPVGSFRRTPIDWQIVLKDYPLNMEILECESDLERARLLAGKTIKVVEHKLFDYKPYGDPNGKPKPKFTPIFEFVS